MAAHCWASTQCAMGGWLARSERVRDPGPAREGPATIVAGVVGGQGFLFGRGNQPLSAARLARVGRRRILVVAGLEKLTALDPPRLIVDTGDPAVDRHAGWLDAGAHGARTLDPGQGREPEPPRLEAAATSMRGLPAGAGEGLHDAQPTAHPWMANSVPALKQADAGRDRRALDRGAVRADPGRPSAASAADLPPGLRSEAQLKRHLTSLLSRTEDCEDNLSFLGAGCWQHHVPAVVDEIVGRFELLTNVWGSPQSDFGRNQAWFEYASQLGELVGMEVVSLPVYSWGCAAGHAIRMAARLTGRREVLSSRAGPTRSGWR